MLTARQFKTWVLVGVAGLGIPLASGCGDDTGLTKRFPVSGTVSYNGKPVENGQITFVPTAEGGAGRAANGLIQKGQFTLTTATPDDGALPGEYKVTITSKDVDDSKVKETVTKYGGGGRQHEIAKATGAAKNLVPAKYQLAETSGLKATVKEQSNTFPFELTD